MLFIWLKTSKPWEVVFDNTNLENKIINIKKDFKILSKNSDFKVLVSENV